MVTMEIAKLIGAYGSPLYVYDAACIRARCRELRRAFPDFELYYACKANTNPAIIKIIRDGGFGIECVSPGEISIALSMGVSPERITYTCGSVHEKELVDVVTQGIRAHLDSLTQVDYFGKNFPGRDISVRLNLGVGAGHHEHVITGGPDSKFGIDAANIDGLKELASKYRLKITGLHQYIGSNILEVETFIEAMDVLFEAAIKIPEVTHLDFGGGLGIAYEPGVSKLDVSALGEAVSERVKKFENEAGKKLKMSFEPGRYLVAESGTLYATVVDIKKNIEKIFVGVDTGKGHLIRPAMYDTYHQIENCTRPDATPTTVTIVGLYCESGDVLAKNRTLPMPELGDILGIQNAGAYGYSMASTYNTRPKPAEILIDGNIATEIRTRALST